VPSGTLGTASPGAGPGQPAAHLPDRWIFVLLLALLAWLPLPWGSKPPAAAALFGFLVAALAAARLALALFPQGALPPLPGAARLALGLWLAWLGWTAVYLVPLPPHWLAALSPAAHAAHAAVDALPGAAALHTLSLLPGASVDQWLLGAGYFALFWLVLATTARNRPRQRLLLTVLMLSGVAQALYGSVMTLSGLEYGFLGPKQHGIGWATGTFVNRNHLAGYLELTMAAGIALVLADLRSGGHASWKHALAGLVDLALSPRLRTRVLIAVMVIALVLTRSRGGNLAFFVALAGCGTLYILLRHPRHLLKSLLFFASLFLVDLLIVSEQYGLEKVVQRIEATELATEQRAIAFRDLVPAIRQHGAVGAGPGTFAAAFAPHRSPELRGHYDHAHNDYAEFLVETGVAGCALLGALALLTLAHGFLILRRRRDRMAGALAFAALMGLASLGLHGLADFNLRIPAVAATLVALMALALSCSSRSRQPPPLEEDTGTDAPSAAPRAR
jgi:putative inorganic carbon (hco3(-)) transporter